MRIGTHPLHAMHLSPMHSKLVPCHPSLCSVMVSLEGPCSLSAAFAAPALCHNRRTLQVPMLFYRVLAEFRTAVMSPNIRISQLNIPRVFLYVHYLRTKYNALLLFSNCRPDSVSAVAKHIGSSLA